MSKTYYDENTNTVFTAHFIKLKYGINPEKDLVTAKRAGIFPLEDCMYGFNVDRYVKIDNTKYRALPAISETELNFILDARDNYE